MAPVVLGGSAIGASKDCGPFCAEGTVGTTPAPFGGAFGRVSAIGASVAEGVERPGVWGGGASAPGLPARRLVRSGAVSAGACVPFVGDGAGGHGAVACATCGVFDAFAAMAGAFGGASASGLPARWLVRFGAVSVGACHPFVGDGAGGNGAVACATCGAKATFSGVLAEGIAGIATCSGDDRTGAMLLRVAGGMLWIGRTACAVAVWPGGTRTSARMAGAFRGGRAGSL